MNMRKGLALDTTPRRTNREWTHSENEYLVEHYEELRACEIASALKRTVTAVYRRARILGLIKQMEDWTDEEIQLALRCPDSSLLSHRTRTAIYQVRSRYGRTST